MKTNQKVYIILINYRQPELTEKCINSIKLSKNIDPFIILVDNHSNDNSVDTFNKLYSNDYFIKVLESNSNKGFAAGNNIGIKYALDNNADYIMLLNNDTEIDPDMINLLLQYANENTVVSPKIYYFDQPDLIWFAGGKYEKGTGRFIHIGEKRIDSVKFDKIHKCDFLTGCCMMLSTKSVIKTGFFDEDYFMYMEDVDYSLRLTQNGIKMLMIPKAKMWHKVGSSSGGEKTKTSIYYGNRNRFFLQKKFHFNFFIRIFTLFSRILLFIKGAIMKTNEVYIGEAIVDYFKSKTGKRKIPFQ